MSRSDSQIRTELFKIAAELVNDRLEKQIEKLVNDAEIVGPAGTYTTPEDTRVADAQTITKTWFDFYSTKGGDDMLESIKQAYELADSKYQDVVTQLRFNAIKFDVTGTEVVSRSAYTLPTDTRVEDTMASAAMFYDLITTG